MSNYSDSKFNNDENSSWNKTFSLVPDGSLVLDIGCSAGVFGEQLMMQKHCVVDGIELNKEDAKIAAEKLRHVHVLNIEQDDLPNDYKYDIIFMGDVIEHLARPIEALKKIKKLLKPNGKLLFSIPNITHMSVRLMLLSGKIEYGRTGLLDETHLHFYNYEEIERVLKSSGLKIVKIDSVKRDIPEDFLTRELEEMGLKITPKFMELARSLNGASYQFIGLAEKSSSESKEILPKKSPIDITEKYLTKLRKSYEERIRILEAKLEYAEREHQKTKNHLLAIINSKSFKIGRAVMYAPGLAKRIKNQDTSKRKLKQVLANYYELNDTGDIKVCVLARDGANHPTSSAFLRLLSPLTYGVTGQKIALSLLPGKVVPAVQKNDVCIVQRTAIQSVHEAQLLVSMLRESGTKLIIDTDDNFGKLSPAHPQYKVQAELVDALNYLKEHADRIWVSTDALATEYKQKRTIYRNSYDDRIWGINSGKILNKDKIRLVYMGTATHDEDFGMVFDQLNKLQAKYPGKFEMTVIGVGQDLPDASWIKKIGLPVSTRLYPNFAKWFIQQNQHDIGLAPLIDSDFNNAKSDIKVLDYFCLGVLPVVSNIKPYKSKELDNFIIRVGYGKDDWYQTIEAIINNPKKYSDQHEKTKPEIRHFLKNYRSVKVISDGMLSEIKSLIDQKK